METAPFEEADTVLVNYVTPEIVLCCAPKGMERDALLRRMNFEEKPGRSYVLACDAPAPCEGHMPPSTAMHRKHFVMKEANQ